MTYEEAKKYWKVFLKEIGYLKKRRPDIEWEEQEEATKLAIEALKKQTPTKPNWVYDDEPLCPYCQEVIEDGDAICENCHQLIDWSE